MLGLLEHLLSAGDARERAGEVAAHGLGYRGRHQKVQQCRVERFQDIGFDVFVDGVGVSGDAADGVVRAPLTPQRQRRQLQCGGPALGRFPQPGNVGCAQAQPIDVQDKGIGLVLIETQILGADFDELVAHAHPAHREPGGVPAGDDDAQMVARVIDEKCHDRLGRRVGHPVPVVDGDRECLSSGVDFVDQRGNDVSSGIAGAFLQDLVELAAECRPRPAHRLDQVGQEPDGVVVIGIDGDPGELNPVGGQFLRPLRGQGALAEARRGVDDRQPALLARAQNAQQSGPVHQGAGWCRRSELRQGRRGNGGLAAVGCVAS
jgi:hypothetical protein